MGEYKGGEISFLGNIFESLQFVNVLQNCDYCGFVCHCVVDVVIS